MYLVLIAWFYVALMMAIAEAVSPVGSILGALMTFALYGVLPIVVIGYILGKPRGGVRAHLPRPPQRLRQMPAAKRPVAPRLRRNENHTEGCETVHHSGSPALPAIVRTPS